MSSDVIVVGIAGGTASGKTTVAQKIQQALGEHAVLLEQDAYYRDASHLSFDQRCQINFDHPDSVDFDLMRTHIQDLKEGKSIEKPRYNFSVHSREPESEHLAPAKIIMAEGILLLAIPELRSEFDIKIYVDTEDDLRLLRRIRRDIEERGRTFESVREQYLETVKPMHLEFVEPSKRYADVIIPRGGENETAIHLVATRLRAELAHLSD